MKFQSPQVWSRILLSVVRLSQEYLIPESQQEELIAACQQIMQKKSAENGGPLLDEALLFSGLISRCRIACHPGSNSVYSQTKQSFRDAFRPEWHLVKADARPSRICQVKSCPPGLTCQHNDVGNNLVIDLTFQVCIKRYRGPQTGNTRCKSAFWFRSTRDEHILGCADDPRSCSIGVLSRYP